MLDLMQVGGGSMPLYSKTIPYLIVDSSLVALQISNKSIWVASDYMPLNGILLLSVFSPPLSFAQPLTFFLQCTSFRDY